MMKKLLLICVVAAICIGLSSAVMASPTLTGSSQTESLGSSTVADDSEEEYSFLEDWIYWAFKDIFGWHRDGPKRHYSANSGPGSDTGDGDGDWDYDPGDGDWDYDPGDGGWDYDPGDGGWDYDPGDGDWDYDPGDGGWDHDPGNGGWDHGNGDWDCDPGQGDWGCGDTGTCPPQTIPAPGALLLGSIGAGIISWLRRRRTL